MKKIYISHPFTGDEVNNRKKASELRARLKQLHPDVCFINPLGMFDNGNGNYVDVLADAIELLSCCDGIILVDGFNRSTGCIAEAAFAKKMGIKIYSADYWLLDEGTEHGA